MGVGRRTFLKLLLSISGILALLHFGPYGSYFSFKPEANVKKKRIANLSQILPGSASYFLYPPTGSGILIRDDTGRLHAYNPMCTHAGCQVGYQAQSGVIACPCHASYFDSTTGEVTGGPARSSLPAIKLQLDKDDDIYAVGLEGED